MSLLTDHFTLTQDWDNVSNGNASVFVTPLSDAQGCEWCVATTQADADLCLNGHSLRPGHDFLWEQSAAGQILWMRCTGFADETEEVPRVTVTSYP